MDNQQHELAHYGLDFQDLFGRPLALIDCQNLFCETDKYARVAHPEAAGLGARTRIKQKYVSGRDVALPFFPPKWGLNERVRREMASIRPSTNSEDAREAPTTVSAATSGPLLVAG